MAATTLTYSGSGGYDGIINWLGENKGATTWANPETSRGLITSRLSSVLGGASGNLASNAWIQSDADADRFHTTSGIGSYMLIDFGSGNAVQLTHWGYRSPSSALNPNDFIFEGRKDDTSDWEAITVSVAGNNVITSNGPNAWYVGAVASSTYFRFLRLRLGPGSGADWGGNDYLTGSALEFWGVYTDAASVNTSEGEAWINEIPADVYAEDTTPSYNGIMQWLGENKGVTTWAHPENTRSLVTTTESSVLGASVAGDSAFDHALDVSSGRFHSNAETGAWWKADFGSGNDVLLTGYLLTEQNSASGPYAFKIQGSNNDSDWTDIRSVTSTEWSTTVARQKYFDLETTTPYRYIRIIHNSGASSYLIIGEIEFYGGYNVDSALQVIAGGAGGGGGGGIGGPIANDGVILQT